MTTNPHLSPGDLHSTRRRVLLVSSEETIRRTLERILGRCGYSVEVVKTGEAALEWASSRRFDAIVSEINLPGPTSGLTVFRQMRDTGIDTPFVFLAEEETERLRQALGCDQSAACLCKEADPDRLKAALAQFLSPQRR